MQSAVESLHSLVYSPETGLYEAFARVGSVVVVGSIDLGLIYPGNPEPDADFNLLVNPDDDLVNLASQIGLSLVQHPELPWHKYEVYDNRKAKRPTTPMSVYLGTKAYVQGGKVAADVWLFNNKVLFDQANQNHFKIKEALTQETTDIILQIKGECQNRGIYLPGYAIYRAVLECRVSTLDGYLNLDSQTRNNLTTYRVT